MRAYSIPTLPAKVEIKERFQEIFFNKITNLFLYKKKLNLPMNNFLKNLLNLYLSIFSLISFTIIFISATLFISSFSEGFWLFILKAMRTIFNLIIIILENYNNLYSLNSI